MGEEIFLPFVKLTTKGIRPLEREASAKLRFILNPIFAILSAIRLKKRTCSFSNGASVQKNKAEKVRKVVLPNPPHAKTHHHPHPGHVTHIFTGQPLMRTICHNMTPVAPVHHLFKTICRVNMARFIQLSRKKKKKNKNESQIAYGLFTMVVIHTTFITSRAVIADIKRTDL